MHNIGYIQLYLGGFDYFDQFWSKLLKFDFVTVPTDMTEISEILKISVRNFEPC